MLHYCLSFLSLLSLPKVRGPGVPAGHRVYDVTQSVDLLPTWANIAGVDLAQSEAVDGKSILPLFNLSRGEVRDVAHFILPQCNAYLKVSNAAVHKSPCNRLIHCCTTIILY